MIFYIFTCILHHTQISKLQNVAQSRVQHCTGIDIAEVMISNLRLSGLNVFSGVVHFPTLYITAMIIYDFDLTGLVLICRFT